MIISQLAENGAFQGLFQACYGDEVRRLTRWGAIFEVRFLREVQFTFTEISEHQYSGSFLAEVETSDGKFGDTSGTFSLQIPRGLSAGDALVILDTAVMRIEIESIPGLL